MDGKIDLPNMKVTELKKLCKEKGIPSSGVKGDLIERLQVVMDAEASTESNGAGTTPTEDELLNVADDSLLDDQPEAKLPDEEETKKETGTVDEAGLKDNAEGAASPDQKTEIKKIVFPSTKSVTSEEAKAARLAKFGPSTDAAKKELRKQRFSTSSSPTATTKPTTEVLKSRAERFGISSSDDKLQARAARFGTAGGALSKGTGSSTVDTEKLKQRAERFGTVTSPTLTKAEENDKIQKRKERFGVVTSTSTKSSDPVEAKKMKRAERFGIAAS